MFWNATYIFIFHVIAHIPHPYEPELRGNIGVHFPSGSRKTVASSPSEMRNAICIGEGRFRKNRCLFNAMTCTPRKTAASTNVVGLSVGLLSQPGTVCFFC